MSTNQIFVGIDPGLGGAACIINGNSIKVHDAPTFIPKPVKPSKASARRNFDLHAMYEIFKPLDGLDVICLLEKVGPRSKEGVVSSFNFGKGVGYWEMAAIACGFNLIDIFPQKWKKDYPEITECKTILDLKINLKSITLEQKKLLKSRDQDKKQRISKEISRFKRQIKEAAKDEARALVIKLYPSLSFMFRLKKHHGRAESLLIARYAKNHELV